MGREYPLLSQSLRCRITVHDRHLLIHQDHIGRTSFRFCGGCQFHSNLAVTSNHHLSPCLPKYEADQPLVVRAVFGQEAAAVAKGMVRKSFQFCTFRSVICEKDIVQQMHTVQCAGGNRE
jgi:hypothetical protein